MAGARRAPEHTHAAPGAPPAAGPRPAGVRSSMGPQGARGPDLFTDPFVPQARLEVHRFGITGYGKGQERVLEQERAVMLGAQVSTASGRAPGRHAGGAGEAAAGQGPGASARGGRGHTCPLSLFQPPKKSYVNYKVLQEQIREQKAAREAAKRTVGVAAGDPSGRHGLGPGATFSALLRVAPPVTPAGWPDAFTCKVCSERQTPAGAAVSRGAHEEGSGCAPSP